MAAAYNERSEHEEIFEEIFKEKTLLDIVVLFLSLSLIIHLLGLFFQDINRIYTISADKVGLVLAVDNSVQRRFESRLIWERLRGADPVHNGDTIRTGAFSQASMEFINGDVILLGENSMVAVNINALGGRFELLSGTLTAQSEISSVIVAGKKEIVISAGAATRINDTDGTPLADTVERVSPIPLAAPRPISPADGSVIRFSGTTASVHFRWEDRALETPGMPRRYNAWFIQVADNPQFDRPVIAKTVLGNSLMSTSLETGGWYWRVVPDSALWNEPVTPGFFQIEYRAEPASLSLVSPFNGANIDGRTGKIVFSCKALAEAEAYLFEVAEDAAFTRLALREETREHYYLYQPPASQFLSGGVYYWRAVSFTPNGESRSAARSFTLGFSPPAVPRLADMTVRVEIGPSQEEEEAPPAPPPAREAPPAPVEIAREPSAAPSRAAVPATAASAAAAIAAAPAAAGEAASEPAAALAGPQSADAPQTPPPAAPIESAPPFLPVTLIEPEAGELFTTQKWIAQRRVDFRWEAVAGAIGYRFTLRREEEAAGRPPLINQFLSDNAFQLFDIRALEKGAYIWSVEAVSGNGARRGDAAERTVYFDFEKAGTPKPNKVMEVE
jgi:hypothetical protein